MSDAPMDPRVPAVMHSVAAKMQAKADAELEDAKRRHRRASEVIEQWERGAHRADEQIAARLKAEAVS